jgi:hypothetical protein
MAVAEDLIGKMIIAIIVLVLALLASWGLILTGHADMEITGNATGIGIQEHSIEAAGQLIESVHDELPNKRSWALFLLETHGYETDGKSLLVVNGTEYSIFENGSIKEAM